MLQFLAAATWDFATNSHSLLLAEYFERTCKVYIYDVTDKNVGALFGRCYIFFYTLSVSLSVLSRAYPVFVNVHIFMYHSCTLPWLTSLPFLFCAFLIFFSLFARTLFISLFFSLSLPVCVDMRVLLLFSRRSDLWLSPPFKWFRFYDDNNNRGK